MAEIAALARIEHAGQMITTPQILADRIREWQDVAHVLTPAVQISAIAPQHAINVAVVVMDTKIDEKGIGTDTYGPASDGRGLPWLKAGERALAKVGLLKIASAAGISWVPEFTGRTDDRKTLHYWEYRAVGVYIGFDGRPQTIEGTVEVDLRDGSAQMKGFTPGQIDAARKSGLRQAESKAMNAAIRSLGLRQKYTAKELEKPFVILRTSYIPDMSDPAVRHMVADRALSGASALYAGRRLPPASNGEVIDVTPEPSGTVARTGETPPMPENRQPPAPEPKRETAPPPTPTTSTPQKPDGPLVVRVETKEGTTKDQRDASGAVTKKGGRPYKRFLIVLSTGEELHSFDAKIAELAQKLQADQVPVDVVTQTSKFGTDIVELRRAGEQPDLLMDDDVTDADLPGGKY